MDTNKKELLAKIDKAIDTLRPHLQNDGGDVRLLDIDANMIVKLEWMGACRQCDMSQMTLKVGLEQAIKTAVPEVSAVVAVPVASVPIHE